MTTANEGELRKRVNTRARIVAASGDVFVAKGIDGTTVDDLVAAAGYTRGAFYSNFSSKEEVFFEYCGLVYSQVAHAVRTHAERTIVSRLDNDALSDAMVDVFSSLRPIASRWAIIDAMASLAALRIEGAREKFEQIRSQGRAELSDALAGILARVGEQPAVPIEQISDTVMGVYLNLMLEERLSQRDSAPVARAILPAVVGALLEPRADDDGSVPGKSAAPAPCTTTG